MLLFFDVVYVSLVFLICSSTVLSRPSTMVLQNNQYTNVVVAIHESIAEDKTLVDKLKADVIITDNFRRKKSVHTRSYRGCGEQGVHVLLNKEFLTLPRAEPYYNSPEKYFVHAFAQFRWGVFQEYAEEGERPFYISLNSGRPEAMRCVFNMRGLVQKNDANHTICYTDIDRDTGLFSDGCLWRPYPYRQPIRASMMDFQFINEIKTFCDDNSTDRQTIHNYESPSKHNRLCEHRSVWDVIQNSPDFQGGINAPVTVTPSQLTPIFKVVKATTRRRRAVIHVDPSTFTGTGIQNRQRIFTHLGRLKREADRHAVSLTISVSGSNSTHGHQINSFEDLKELSSDLSGSNYSVLYTNKTPDNSDEDTDIILISDHKPRNTFQDIVTRGNALLDHFRYSLENDPVAEEAFSIIKKEQKAIFPGETLKNTVHVDDSFTSNVSFVFHYEQTKPSINIYPPSGTPLVLLSPEDVEEFREIVFLCRAQAGEWRYTIKSNDSQEISLLVTAKTSILHNIDVRLTTERPDMTSPYFRMYVDVTQYHHPIVGLNVTANIDTPSGHLNFVQLLDNGAGSDLMKGDGIYSRYFINVMDPGHYLVTITVFGQHGHVMRKEEYFHEERHGEIQGSPKHVTRTLIKGPLERHVGRHSVYFGPSDVRNNTLNDVIPPCRITDLSVSKHVLYKDTFILKFTAPGDNLDIGKVSHYEVYFGEELTSIRDFIAYTATASYKGQGHITRIIYKASSVAMETEMITYRINNVSRIGPVVFGVVGVDSAGNKARVSNIVTVQVNSA